MNLLIRTDASAQIGTGHVMRCLALAQGWQAQGGNVTFLTANLPLALRSRLETAGITVIPLTEAIATPADAAQAIAVARQLQAQWLILDGYQFDSRYQHELKQAGLRLLVLDDYGHCEHYWADLVLNQNLSATPELYQQREAYTRLLLGTSYVLLRREFWPWQGYDRPMPNRATRLLVTLGGADPENTSLKVIQALQGMNDSDLEVRLVVGGSNPHLPSLEAAVRASSLPLKLECNVLQMPELMAWADLAIAAGGTTCWELAFMGVPMVLLILAENQQAIVEHLTQMGLTRSLGWHDRVEAAAIREVVTELMQSPEARLAMGRAGQQLIDGEGIGRVIMHLRGQEIRLRPARLGDSQRIWEWANDPAVRSVSFSSDPIPWPTHAAWFCQKLQDPHCHFWLVVDGEDQPLGQVRLEGKGREKTISLSLAPQQRGKGLGTQVITLAVEAAMGTAAIDRIHALIKPDNLASIRAFEQAGFSYLGIDSSHGQTALHYGYVKSG